VCAPHGAPPSGRGRRALLLDFGDLVESLSGRYITAEDVGVGAEDLVTIGERTDHLTGLPADHGGLGDPSPFTALGVESAIRACLRRRFGSAELTGRRVAIVGLGHVGGELARRLAEHGADLLVSDIDAGKRGVAGDLGAHWADPREAMLAECDVLAPCALGGAIHNDNAGKLRCHIVCGSANNQLASEGLDEALARRGITYAPDFIVNAGGLIHVYNELRGRADDDAPELGPAVGANTELVLAAAAERSVTPLKAAHELARERLDSARREPAAVA
jgi:leucine dehydrogenase